MESDHFLLTASAEFSVLTQAAENCLRDEGFAYTQNRTNDLVEYEIERPVYFRIVIHRRNDPDLGNFLMPSIKASKGTFLDIWFSPDQTASKNREAFLFARQFLKSLVKTLPQPPWEGLKFRESGKAKKKWKELTSEVP